MNDSAIMFILIPIIVAAAAVGIYYSYLAAKKRREAFLALAAELGFTFDPNKDRSHDEYYAHFEIFRKGHSRAAYNTLSGQTTIDDRQFSIKMGDFTYKVTRHSGKNRTTSTYNFSYLIVHLPFALVPDVLIRPENLFDKLAGAIGFDDIDFESIEFSKRFLVKSKDKRFAYDLIHPRMMEFMLASKPPCIDLENGRCCLSDGSRRWTPDQFKSHMQFMAQFIDLWPDHLTKQLDSP